VRQEFVGVGGKSPGTVMHRRPSLFLHDLEPRRSYVPFARIQQLLQGGGRRPSRDQQHFVIACVHANGKLHSVLRPARRFQLAAVRVVILPVRMLTTVECARMKGARIEHTSVYA
jgi:hypothetical protein